MSRWKTLSFRCPNCQLVEHFVEDVDAVEKHNCSACGGEMQQTIGAPRVMENAWPDGRKRPDSWYLEKAARKAEAKAYDLPVEKRGEVRKEVDEIRKEIKK
jgi:hypothetical protein